MPERQHGTAVAIDGRAVLIRGPSGSGKSDLALRLIAAGARWPGLRGEPVLVADDQVELSLADGGVVVSPPAAIAGRIEVRGLGILSVPYLPQARLSLIADLIAREAIARLPEPDKVLILGVPIPRIDLDAFAASAPAKILVMLAAMA